MSAENLFKQFFHTNNVFDVNDSWSLFPSHGPYGPYGPHSIHGPRSIHSKHDNFRNQHNNHNQYKPDGNHNQYKPKGNPTTIDLSCTLEELYYGKNKKLKIRRKIYKGPTNPHANENRIIELKIEPGWKDGTKITFENMGDEGPDIVPGD